MKKSNKVSLFYILSAISLLLVLMFGGIYGIYVSVGLNFVKNSVAVLPEGSAGVASNVSFGGTVNFEYSMIGVIILSIALVVISIFEFVSLIRQIILFKQFKVIRNSMIETAVEEKVKSKKSVIFFAILLDIISFVVGIIGIFINSRSFVGNRFAWIFYLIDAMIILLSLTSMVLFIVKLRNNKKMMEDKCEIKKSDLEKESDNHQSLKSSKYNIDDLEYKLLKLKHLKTSKIISDDEYKSFRERLIDGEELVEEKE